MPNFNGESSSQRRVAIYIRVSTHEQKVDGYGLEAQKSRLMEYIANNKAQNFVTKPEWFFSDAHPGSDLNREALNRLRELIKAKKVDAILVWKIDRLSRSLKHLLTLFDEFEQNEVSFVSLQENLDFKGPMGKLIFQIFGAIAQFERELIKDRTKMGRITSASMGNFTGSSIPYGYKPVLNKGGKGKKLVIIPKERDIIREIFNWYIYDEVGYGLIAKKLNKLKVPTGSHTRAKGKFSPWTEKRIRNIIHNTIYRGEFVANKTDDRGKELPEAKWTNVDVPPCISEFVFQQAQVVSSKKTGGRKDTPYMLSGKLVDMTLTRPKKFSGAKRNKGGFSYRRQQFKKDGQHYSVFEFPGKQMDDYIWEKIMEALKDPEVFIEHYLSKKYADPTKVKQLETQLSNLREQQANAELAIARIEEAYERGAYSEEKLNDRLSKRNKEISGADTEIQAIEDELNFKASIDTEVSKLKDASKQLKYRLDKLTPKQKKVLANLFVDRVEMRRKPKSRNEKGRVTRWDITADVHFRFNPTKFPTRLIAGRTAKAQQKATKASAHTQQRQGGAGGQD
jgi:site-specific DNA recombinase